ncbi:MAG: tetratricopeptide repeat protein [Planctomycetes bacterium]|nr:tetratricopeptide repeat protein [Planctomycetota bacterium]
MRKRAKGSPEDSTREAGNVSRRDTVADSSGAFSAAGGPGRARELEPGARIDTRYEILSVLGEGGMGRVYRVRDLKLGREVALKTIAVPRASEAVRRRFLAEARTTAQLSHPGIVPVYDAGSLPDGELYLTMKVVEGQTLRAIFGSPAARNRERGRFLKILAAVADALAYAHERGVVHRDLKPENVMVSRSGVAVVMDWGLAKIFGAAGALGGEDGRGRQAPVDLGEARSGKTLAGTLLGTLPYMAPEQVEGRVGEIDSRTDVWALGAILWEILFGEKPFEGDTAVRTAAAILDHEPRTRAYRARKAPRELLAIALKCLEKNPGRRYPGAGPFRDDIERFLARKSVSALPASGGRRAVLFARRNPVLVTAGAILAVVVAGAGTGLWIAYARAGEELEKRIAAEEEREEARAREEAVQRALLEVDDLVRSAGNLGMDQEDGVRARFEGIMRRVPESAFPWRERGIWYLRHRFPGTGCRPLDTETVRARAEADFLAAVERDPSDSLSLFYLSVIEAERRFFEKAVEYLRRMDASAPANEFRDYATGSLLRDAARGARTDEERRELLGQAALAYDRALAAKPDFVWALFGRAEVLYDLEEYENALADFDRAAQIAPETPQLHANRGGTLHRLGRIEEAAEAFERAIGIDPRCATAVYGLGLCHRSRDERDEALKAFSEAIELDPGLAEAWDNRGIERCDAGDLAGAIADHTRAIELEPGAKQGWLNRAAARRTLALRLLDAGELDRAASEREAALADLDRALDIDPRYALAYVNRAAVRADGGDHGDAVEDCDRAIEIARNDPEIWFQRGLSNLALQDFQTASQDFTQALALTPGLAKAHLHRAKCRSALGDVASAIEDQTRALALDPDYVEAYNDRGLDRLRVAEGLDSERRAEEARAARQAAVEDFDAALGRSPDYIPALGNRGLANYLLGRWDAAVTDFERFLELAPDHAKAARFRELRDDAARRRN